MGIVFPAGAPCPEVVMATGVPKMSLDDRQTKHFFIMFVINVPKCNKYIFFQIVDKIPFVWDNFCFNIFKKGRPASYKKLFNLEWGTF